MQQKITKIIAALLAITLLYANSAAVISYAADNFLTDQEIESQKTSTNNANVEFDVYPLVFIEIGADILFREVAHIRE